jgi:hypothetical protein
MATTRSYVFAAALSSLALVACGGSDGGNEVIVPQGEHHHYVLKNLFVPTSTTAVEQMGLDLGRPTSNKPDGIIDNKLGMALVSLAGFDFDLQGTIQTALNKGEVILLMDFQTEDFMNTSAAGFQVYLADTDTAMPTPCVDANDMTCGRHLSGTGMFAIDSTSPMDALVTGKVLNGTFKGGPGDISLPLTIAGTPVVFDLINARVELTGISATGIMEGKLAGMITEEELNNDVFPAVHAELQPLIAADCTKLDMPTMACGCPDGSIGKTIIDFFDELPAPDGDCMVSLDEVKNNNLVKSLLGPDVCSKSSCPADMEDALSIGIKVSATSATYTVP